MPRRRPGKLTRVGFVQPLLLFRDALEQFWPTPVPSQEPGRRAGVEEHMNGIIYLVGLIVVVLAILSFLGLR
jgi:hypothetical protein